MDKNIERIRRQTIQESRQEWPCFDSQPAPDGNIREQVYEICADDDAAHGYMDSDRIWDAIVNRFGWVPPEADAAFEQAKAQFKFE